MVFVPVGNLYGRGASDNKAPVLAWIHAVEAYQALNMVRNTPVIFDSSSCNRRIKSDVRGGGGCSGTVTSSGTKGQITALICKSSLAWKHLKYKERKQRDVPQARQTLKITPLI